MKKIISVLFLALFLSSCGGEENTSNVSQDAAQTQEIVNVTASIIPLASVINAIGGDYVDVNTIIPAGVSPHGFDLSAKDVVALEKSDITFLIGLEQIDSFLEKPLEGKKYVELAQGIDLLEAEAHDHSDHEDEHEDEHSDEEIMHQHIFCDQDLHSQLNIDCLQHNNYHNHNEHEDEHDDHSVDAHVWLGEENMYLIAGKIRNELIALMPEQANLFNANTEIFTERVSEIYEDFRETNNGKTAGEFIVFHDAYNYLMESANINPDLKVPFSENVLHESGTAHMAELIEEIGLHSIKNVFSEPQFSDGNLQSFAQQYNLNIAILDPLGTDDSATGYLENLQTNLDNISIIYE